MVCITKPRPYLLAFLVVTFISTAATQEEEEEEPISVGAPVTAVQAGKDAEIECTTSLEENPKLLWYKGDNATASQLIPEDDHISIFANSTTGLLTIRWAKLNDTGTYLCQTEGGNHTVTAELHVYEMPSYFKEGMIIVGINAALVLLFIVCGVYTCIQKRRKPKPGKLQAKKKINTEL